MYNRNKKIIIALVSISILVIVSLCYFLFFAVNKETEEKYPKVEIYKYEVASNKFKYYLDVIDANKIALKGTLKYKCNKDDCTKAKSLYAEGNIYNDYVLINDDNLIIYDFIKKEKITISDITEYDYADFINDGKYVLISINGYYKVFNVEKMTLSEPFKSDILATKNDKPFIIMDKYIVTIENGKYGIINMETGNNIFDNYYDYIDCVNTYCIFTSKGKSTVYDIARDDDNVLVQSANKILYYDENYVIYSLNNEVNMLNVESLDSKKLPFNDNTKVEALTEKLLTYNDNNKCYNYVLKDSISKSTECSPKVFTTDVFASSETKTGVTVRENEITKSLYELTVTNNKLYDNSGIYYDYININSKDSNIETKTYTVNVTSEEAYNFLDYLAFKMELSGFEKMIFINRWLPVFTSNVNSYVELSFIDDYSYIPGVNVLTKSDNYKGLVFKINKGYKENANVIEDINTDVLNRTGFSIITLSGLSY